VRDQDQAELLRKKERKKKKKKNTQASGLLGSKEDECGVQSGRVAWHLCKVQPESCTHYRA
jgi:hypothetical protein